MAQLNQNFLKLPGNYLFAEIRKRVDAYTQANPDSDVIKLGIGDVTRPLVPSVIQAMHEAVEDMGNIDTFKGYGPDPGYDFLIDAIHNTYADGTIEKDEIFVSTGAKSDTANFQEIFDIGCKIAVTDPVYPVYIDANAMSGRAGEFIDGKWSNVVYLPCTAENNFVPALPNEKVDLIYLCLPNNPTGTTLSKPQLKEWVDYANENNAVILFDGAYEAFISEENVPKSIFEIPGARTCAVEFRSFSKLAGFTGTRCAYTVIPKELMVTDEKGDSVPLLNLWKRRQATKFNGVSYIIQKGAAAAISEKGLEEIKEVIAYYLKNAKIIREGLEDLGLTVYGGVNAPYIWMKVPEGYDSWSFFDKLLNDINVVGTPGAGFGPHGEGYFRLTAFGSYENTVKAMLRMKTLKF